MDLEEQVEALRDKVENLEDENRQLRDKVTGSDAEENLEKGKISRREFLKKAGLGTAGLTALTLLPGASALNVRSNEGMQVFDDGTEYLDVTQSGVEIRDTDLDVVNNSGTEVIQVPVYQDVSDLPSKGEGSIAYVKNDNKLYVQDSN